MLVEPLTTWLLVRISPFEPMIMPEPAASPEPTMVLMSTIAGLILVAMASVLLDWPPVPGVTWVMGELGDVVCWATWWEVTARARPQPMPAPTPAATIAIRTTTAAIWPQIEVAGGAGGGGAGAHTGAAPVVSGGSSVGSSCGAGCSGPPGSEGVI